MGLTARAIELSENIRRYFDAVKHLDIRNDMSLMLMRGAMLKDQIDLLLEEIDAVTDDPQIGKSAAQLYAAVKIDDDALCGVIKTLQEAKNTMELVIEMQVVSQIKTLKERIGE